MKIQHFLFSLPLVLGLAAGSLAGCDGDDDGGGAKDVCTQAGEAINSECPIEDGGDGSDGEPVACEGEAECQSQCVLDHTAGVCDVLAGTFDSQEAMDYIACSGECTA